MASELEKAIADAFKSRNITALGGFLQKPINEAVKCSAEFLNKLDILINQSLSEKDSNAVSIALTVIYKWGKNLKFPMGTQGITGLIDQGLIQKMVQWFDKCKQLWILHGPQFDQSLSRLSEDFFDVLTMVHKASKDGMFGIQFFLYHIGHLVNDARIFIFIRKKAISTLTIILKNVPASPEREKFFTSLDTSDIMTNLAGQIMQCGDYDMQVSLIEVLFRLTTTDQRQKLSSHWFSMAQVACAFWQIKPLEFEVDCRTFLIFVNGLQGENGRVMSYPCLEVYLDAFKLLKPSDDKLSKFWIDFNLGSQSISFYFSLCDEKSPTSLWDSICISENELQSYTLTEKGTKQILQLRLSEVVMTGSLQGSSITIIFCSTLNILQTVCCIYGHRKYKSTIRKTSVANMTLNIIEEDKSQNCIPESQLSLGVDVKNINNFLGAVETSSQVPANMMLSELTTFSNRSSKGRTHQSSMYYYKMTIPLISESVKIEGQGTEQSQEDTFVPGTQLLTERNIERHSLVETSSRKSTSKQETNSNDMENARAGDVTKLLSKIPSNSANQRLPKKAISEPGKPSVNKRPRRAATLGKNYEEPYTDESSSELEMPQSTKRNSIIAQPNKSSVTKIHAQKPTSKRSHPDQLASQSCTERSQCRPSPVPPLRDLRRTPQFLECSPTACGTRGARICPEQTQAPNTPRLSSRGGLISGSEMSTHLMEMAFSPAFSLPPSSTLKETPVIQQSSLSVASLPLAFKKASAIVTSPHSHFSVSDLNCSFTPESDVSQVSVCLSIQVQQSTIASQAEKTPHSNKEPTFISDAEKITEGKGLATCSSMMTDHSTIDGGNEEMHLEDLELPNVAMNFSNLSQLLSNKLKAKFYIQNNVKILNMFYKENMRTIQEHIFALHTQLGKHSVAEVLEPVTANYLQEAGYTPVFGLFARKLAIVQKVFLNEVHKLKKGRAMLSSIENDLKICLEKQNTFFQSYHKQAIKSIAVLKRTLRDLRLSHKYDEQLFISQMAHLKKDMESVQARLLRTMASQQSPEHEAASIISCPRRKSDLLMRL
nr:synaptonemal complex protein 2-like [Nerophis lumbriciformis]